MGKGGMAETWEFWGVGVFEREGERSGASRSRYGGYVVGHLWMVGAITEILRGDVGKT